MGLVRQMEDVQIVFTSYDEQTENTLLAVDIMDIKLNEEDLIGGKAQIRIKNRAGVNKAKFYEGYKTNVKVQWTGGALTSFWLGRITKKQPANEAYQRQHIAIDVIDEGSWTLSGINTTTYHTYASVDAGAIVKAILDAYSTFNTAHINITTGTTLSITIPIGRNILDIIREVIQGTNHTFYVDETGAAWLVARGASSSYTLGELNGKMFTVDRDILSVKNDIMVKGAHLTDATSCKQEGPPDGYWAIDNNANRRMKKFTPAGTMTLASVMAYNSTGSTHNLLIRIQPDNGYGTGPADVDNYSLDLASIFVPNSNISEVEGETVGAAIDAELTAGVSDYWIIAESDSGTGNLLSVGYKVVTSVNTLIYEVDAWKELINTPGTGTDAASIILYGTRAHTHTDRNLTTQNEVDQKAAALLVEYKDPAKTAAGELLSDIFSGAHARVGQGVTVNLPDEELDGVILGIVGITWSIRSANGTFLDIPSLVLSNTPPPLQDGDWAAQIGRKLDSVNRAVSTVQASNKTSPIHPIGGAKHSTSTLAQFNTKISDHAAVGTNDARLSDARTPTAHAHAPADVTGTAVITDDARLSDARTPTAHDHEGIAIKSTGEAGGVKFLREDGDGTCSWQEPSGAPEGTAVKSTGETGAVKFLREDGDDTCSWQAIPAPDLSEMAIPVYNDTGSSIAAGSVCYVSGDDGVPLNFLITLAKADASANAKGWLVMTKAAIPDETAGEAWVLGRQDDVGTGYTSGNPLYLSPSTAGAITGTLPATSGQIVRIVGYALGNTDIFFNPDKTYITVY
jgi:hypothetical protein